MVTKTVGQVVHFEIPVKDFAAAQDFYEVFGWEMNEMPGMDYVGVRTTPADEQGMPIDRGAINGGMMHPTDEVKGPVVAIQVPSVDEYCEKVVEKGGKVVMPKIQIGEMGFYAYVADPEGNVLGLWEPMGV